MAGATELPEVVQNWTASVGEYVAAMEEMLQATRQVAEEVIELQAEIDALHGKDITIGLDTSGVAAAAATAAAVNDLGNAESKAAQDGFDLFTMLDALAQAEASSAQTARMLGQDSADMAVVLGKTATASDGAAAATGRATFGWFRWLGALNRTQFALFDGVLPGIFGAVGGLHLLADAAIEVAAVVIPAAIALAAFGAAAAPTVGDIVTHMKNLLTVTTATSQSLYPMTGAFQKMADAVKPQVYQLFGEALNTATKNAGAFTKLASQTGSVLDQLGARLEAALTSSNFSQFMAHAVTDVAKLGDIVGNLGGIIGNLLRTVPGYAQYLLNFADGFTKVGEAVTGSGIFQGLAKIGLAAHGAILYTGLLATGFTRLMTGMGRFPGLLSLASDAFGAGALALEKLGGEGNIAARAMGTLSSKLSLAQGLPWGWITLGAALVGVLAYKFITAKDAADNFIASFNQGLGAAPLTKVTADISSGLTVMNGRMADAKAQMDQFSGAGLAVGRALAPIAPGLQSVGNWFTRLNDVIDQGANSLLHFNAFATNNQQAMAHSASGAATAVHDYRAYQAEIATLNQESVTFHTRLGELAVAFGGTSQAMGILTAAGIKASQMMDHSAKAWAQIITQVNATIAAYRAMGQQGGILGADMNAMTIASSDQVQAMTNLNNAWDTTIGIVSGGQSAFISFEQAIHQGTGSIAGVAAAAKAAGASMNGMNTQSLALRSAWQGAYAGGAKLVDALRMMISVSPNAAAQNKNLSQSVKDVVAQLAQQGSKSAASRAELVSLAQEVNPAITNFTQLKDWLGKTGNAGQDLNKRLASMGVNIQDLAKDASQLSGVMQQQVTTQFSAVKMAANGTTTAISNLANAVGHNASAATQSQAKLTLFNDLVHKDGMTAQAAAALISALTGTIYKIPKSWHTNITTNAPQVLGQLHQIQLGVDSLHGKAITITTNYVNIGGATAQGTGGMRIHGQHGGVIPGYMPGRDIVPAMLSPGEGILNPHAVRMLGAGWVHAVNAMAERGGSVNPAALRTGGGGGGGGGGGNVMLKVYLDGKEMFGNNKVQVLNYNTRNSGGRTGKWIPS